MSLPLPHSCSPKTVSIYGFPITWQTKFQTIKTTGKIMGCILVFQCSHFQISVRITQDSEPNFSQHSPNSIRSWILGDWSSDLSVPFSKFRFLLRNKKARCKEWRQKDRHIAIILYGNYPHLHLMIYPIHHPRDPQPNTNHTAQCSLHALLAKRNISKHWLYIIKY
jgi:hypothetical protein